MNDELIRTDWLPGNVSPIYSGVYERNYNNGVGEASIYFCHYDTLSDSWGIGLVSITEAENYPATITRAGNQSLPWRGIAAPPNTVNTKLVLQKEAEAENLRDKIINDIKMLLHEFTGSEPVFLHVIAATMGEKEEPRMHVFTHGIQIN